MTGPVATFAEGERATVAAALDDAVPGSVELGALDYVERLLGALDHDPPQVWRAPGAWAGDGPGWLELSPWERAAWQRRIASWRATCRRVIESTADDADGRVVHGHACEATYGDPAYGGNRDGAAWQRIDFPEPIFPPSRQP